MRLWLVGAKPTKLTKPCHCTAVLSVDGVALELLPMCQCIVSAGGDWLPAVESVDDVRVRDSAFAVCGGALSASTATRSGCIVNALAAWPDCDALPSVSYECLDFDMVDQAVGLAAALA